MIGFIRELMGIGKALVGAGTKADKDALEARKAVANSQAEINREEISGAPQSGLRLWRGALGWALCLCFVWEVIVRPVIGTYWPQAKLPPSFLQEITGLLLGMLGLGI